MELGAGRRLTLSVGLLVAIQLLTSLVTIILLERMSPRIDGILKENVASVQAVEEMALALAESAIDDGSHERFFSALGRAKGNVTEAEERPALAELEAVAEAALAGDEKARRKATLALRRLADVNRKAMDQAGADTRRLGSAGAWAAVLLGLTGLFASGITIRRMKRRVLGPIADITRAVVAHRAGDRHRRCTDTHAEAELGLVAHTLNDLFDLRERAGDVDAPATAASDDRAALLYLLDERSEPVLIAGQRGQVLAANQRALELLSGPGGSQWHASITTAVRNGKSDPSLDLRRIGDSDQWLCAVKTR
jgi:hypothetical protein